MDKETGEPVLDDKGNEIKASAEFVAKDKNGTVDVEFHFSGVNLANKSVVAFETVKYDGREVAVHADIDDVDQTVEIENRRLLRLRISRTIQNRRRIKHPLWAFLAFGAALAAAGSIIFIIRKRKAEGK